MEKQQPVQRYFTAILFRIQHILLFSDIGTVLEPLTICVACGTMVIKRQCYK